MKKSSTKRTSILVTPEIEKDILSSKIDANNLIEKLILNSPPIENIKQEWIVRFVRLSNDSYKKLSNLSHSSNLSKGDIVRRLLENYFHKNKKTS
jgi:hypothetical protein